MVRQVTQNLMVTVNEIQRSFADMGEPYTRTSVSVALLQSGIYDGMARQKLFLTKRHVTAHWEFTLAP